MTGPTRIKLSDKILEELKKHPEGIWVRKLARILNEPVMTVYKYVTRDDYLGRYLITTKLPKEEGGHLMIKLKGLEEEIEDVEEEENEEENQEDYYIS